MVNVDATYKVIKCTTFLCINVKYLDHVINNHLINNDDSAK